jgi:D-alanyl-lipoteichoic acid acyltransferase DltB (MBOAT superfamily)
MLLLFARIIVALLALLVLFFAYIKNNTLGKLSAFVILAAILLAQLFNGFAGVISNIDFLNFLENIFRGIAGLVIYAELVFLIILVFFSKHKTKEALLNWSIIGYVILVLLIQFNVFS